MHRRADSLALLLAAALPTLLVWIYFVAAAGQASAAQQAVYAAGKALQFAFPIVWVGLVARERLRLLGQGRGGVGEGIAFGAVVLAGMLAGYYAWIGPSGMLDEMGHKFRDKLAGFGVNSPQAYLAVFAFYVLAHSLLEEYYWRWFVFGRLRRLVPLGVAIGLGSLAFTLHHLVPLTLYLGWRSPWTWLMAASVAVGGAYWAWLYHRSGSLLGPWLGHLLIDAGIFGIGYDLAGM